MLARDFGFIRGTGESNRPVNGTSQNLDGSGILKVLVALREPQVETMQARQTSMIAEGRLVLHRYCEDMVPCVLDKHKRRVYVGQAR